MGDAPKAQEMTRGSTKVAPAFVLQPKQFVVFLDLEQPLGLTIDSCDDDPKNPAAYPAMITWVDQDGQADVGKIKMGMQIIGLAGESTEGKTSEEVVQMITDAKQANKKKIQIEVYHQRAGRGWLLPGLFMKFPRLFDEPLPRNHRAYPNEGGATMIERWGGPILKFEPACLFYTICPCLAYSTIGGFNMAEIASDGIQQPDCRRACFNLTAMGCGYYNAFCCWAQGNRRQSLEVKLHTATDGVNLADECCVTGCPCKTACLHLCCHPCALSQEVRAVNAYKKAVGFAPPSKKQSISVTGFLCGIFKANFPCACPATVAMMFMCPTACGK